MTRHALWYLGAALPAAAAGIGVLLLLGGVSDGAFPVSSIGGGILSMALSGSVMSLVYAAVLWLSRNPEFRAILVPLAARLRRR